MVDCDASCVGFGAVSHQGGGPIAFFSRAVSPHHAKLAAYECQLIGFVKPLRHWRPYLWEHTFLVRTDHYSLKFLLDQRLSTIPQHTWVSKLFGYDFFVEFRPGQENAAADALSRRDEEGIVVHALSWTTFVVFTALQQEVNSIAELVVLREKILAGTSEAGWSLVDGLILF